MLLAMFSALQTVSPALDQMRHERAKLEKAHIQFALEGPGGASRFEYRRGAKGDWLVRPQFDNPDLFEELALRDQGFLQSETLPSYLFDDDGSYWARSEVAISLSHVPKVDWAAISVPDPLRIGFDFAFSASQPPLERRCIRVKPDETLPNGNIRVEAEVEPGNVFVAWFISPEKGWQTVRMEEWETGNSQKRITEYQVQQTDGIWFPISALSHDAEGNLLQKFSLTAEPKFNRDELPAMLDLPLLGVEPGFVLRGKAPTEPAQVWDGTEFVSSEEWKDGLRFGRYKVGPAVAKHKQRSDWLIELRRTAVASEHIPLLPDQWERFTTSFCNRYKLRDEQTQKALEVCKQCRDRATKEVVRDATFAARMKDLEIQRGNNREWYKAAAAFVSANATELAPAKRVFEEELKPRLYKIPTREQIEAVGDPFGIRKPASSSQPVR